MPQPSRLRRATKWTVFSTCLLVIAAWVFSLVSEVSYTSDTCEVSQDSLYGFVWYSAAIGNGQFHFSRVPIQVVETSAHALSANEEYARARFFRESRSSARPPLLPGWRITLSPIWNVAPVSLRERLGLLLPASMNLMGAPHVYVSIPIWSILVIPALIAMRLWYADRPKIPAGHCRKCGYDLTGNISGTCSECGQRIRPTQT